MYLNIEEEMVKGPIQTPGKYEVFIKSCTELNKGIKKKNANGPVYVILFESSDGIGIFEHEMTVDNNNKSFWTTAKFMRTLGFTGNVKITPEMLVGLKLKIVLEEFEGDTGKIIFFKEAEKSDRFQNDNLSMGPSPMGPNSMAPNMGPNTMAPNTMAPNTMAPNTNLEPPKTSVNEAFGTNHLGENDNGWEKPDSF